MNTKFIITFALVALSASVANSSKNVRYSGTKGGSFAAPIESGVKAPLAQHWTQSAAPLTQQAYATKGGEIKGAVKGQESFGVKAPLQESFGVKTPLQESFGVKAPLQQSSSLEMTKTQLPTVAAPIIQQNYATKGGEFRAVKGQESFGVKAPAEMTKTVQQTQWTHSAPLQQQSWATKGGYQSEYRAVKGHDSYVQQSHPVEMVKGSVAAPTKTAPVYQSSFPTKTAATYQPSYSTKGGLHQASQWAPLHHQTYATKGSYQSSDYRAVKGGQETYVQQPRYVQSATKGYSTKGLY